jgi:3-oxoacyl-[acyl-carrier-protein] synthase-3
MHALTFKGIRIASTGSYIPSEVVSNDEITDGLPTSSEWVQENLGIVERRRSEPQELTSDLATVAGRRALENAGLLPNEIDLLIVATATPDRKAPSTACIVQMKLGITNRCPAFDIAAVCSGFLYSMTVAAQFIESGACRKVLVIGADTFSKITDWGHRSCVFFGDGAGAVVMERNSFGNGFFSSLLFADGAGMNGFTVFPGDATFSMDTKAVYSSATTVLPQAINDLLQEHKLAIDDVAMIVPHQPSIRVLKRTAEILNAPIGKIQMNLQRYANTAGATVPLLLDELNQRSAIKAGDLVLFAAVGSGWTWGSALYRWD